MKTKVKNSCSADLMFSLFKAFSRMASDTSDLRRRGLLERHIPINCLLNMFIWLEAPRIVCGFMRPTRNRSKERFELTFAQIIVSHCDPRHGKRLAAIYYLNIPKTTRAP
jgi:hypothetical protein